MLGADVGSNETRILKSEFRDPLIPWRNAEEVMYNWERDSEYIECGSWKILNSWIGGKYHKKSIR